MYAQPDKLQRDQTRTASHAVAQNKNNKKQGFVFEDNRSGVAIQRQWEIFTEQDFAPVENERVQMPGIMQRATMSYPGNVIQRSAVSDVVMLLLRPAPNHVERTGKFKVAARLERINNELKVAVDDDKRERLEAYKRILINGNSFDARVRAHELAKKLPTADLKRIPDVQYKESLEGGKKRVEFAKENSGKVLGDTRNKINNEQAKKLIAKMTAAKVTFNFDYNAAKNWSMPSMLNSFEVLEHHNIMAGNLKGHVDSRDKIEHEQFGIPRGMDDDIEKIVGDEAQARALNKKVSPNLRPKYAALNFAGYHQGAAPSTYYGNSHMQFKNTIKKRCTITGGDSLGAAGGLAGLAFPLTEDGIKGLVEYCSREAGKGGYRWHSLDTQGQDEINTSGENADNPDYNFIEVQIHGDVIYEVDIAKIVIASSELNGEAPDQAIKNMKKITEVGNVVVE